MMACPTLRNSKVTVGEAEVTPVFTSLQYCYSIQPQKHASTIWSLAQSLLEADEATMSHLKEQILGYFRIQNFWNFLINRYGLSQVQITQFQHGFGTLWGLPTVSYILVCHSATPSSISNCHTSSERGLKYLSYNPNCLYITLLISLCEHQS